MENSHALHPVLYEINTRCWLRQLSQQAGKEVGLADVPESIFAHWQALGFTHIWLMGVWMSGPLRKVLGPGVTARSVTSSRGSPETALPEIGDSPYAISAYEIPEEWGGEFGLRIFRETLHRHGLKLILDFVPNHVGLHHPWLARRPELFVGDTAKSAGLFRPHKGSRWIAHGRDPYFPHWKDTAQLDYRRAETHQAMIEVLQAIAPLCDGVRCDMAMLVLRDIFERNWAALPSSTGPPTSGEFWFEAISTIKKQHADFLFLAEVYWDLEGQLQSLGFDFTYDKTLYDYLMRHESPKVLPHLLGLSAESLARSAHFLENHDEPRVAAVLDLPEHQAAALLTLSLPGMRFLHDGQLTGAKVQVSVHALRRPDEPAQKEIQQLYERLLETLKTSAIGKGRWRLLPPRAAWSENPTSQYLVAIQWESADLGFDLAVVNLSSNRSQCYVSLDIPALGQSNWTMKDMLGDEGYDRSGRDLEERGLYLDLSPHGAQLFHFTPMQ